MRGGVRRLAARLAGAALAALAALAAVAPPAYAVSDEAILAKTPPKLLSAFGFFADLPALEPAEGVVPFALATPLFSDGALKRRFVYLPAGRAAAYDGEEAFGFPVGTALIKNFAFPADFREPERDLRLVETRVLLRGQQGWRAWAYLWNAEQTDAALNIAGARVEIATVAADGAPLAFTYAVPNRNQCKACHALADELVPLGPKARNLNLDLDYASGRENQLAFWTASGMLDGAPVPADAPAVPDWRDAAAPLGERARAWLDVNCAHCHRAEGPAGNSGLFLTWQEDDPVKLGVGKRPVAAGRGSGGLSFDIVPGDPAASILVHRVASTEPGVMMPELGRHLPDADAVALLSAWIAAME